MTNDNDIYNLHSGSSRILRHSGTRYRRQLRCFGGPNSLRRIVLRCLFSQYHGRWARGCVLLLVIEKSLDGHRNTRNVTIVRNASYVNAYQTRTRPVPQR